MTDIHKTNRLEFNYIADGVYIGTNMCCQVDFDKDLLKKNGITADISAEEERIDAPFGVKFFIWIPIKDHTAPTNNQLEFGASVLKNLVNLKQKTYLHCKYGHGRSPTLMAAYLIKYKKMSPEQAVASIKKKRPSIHLEKAQFRALEKFSKIDN